MENTAGLTDVTTTDNNTNTVAVLEPPKEFVYEYQPTDEQGRPIGGKQVFKGTSEHEIIEKIANANIHATRKIREQARRLRLGDIDKETIPDDAPKAVHTVVNPRNLSAEERLEISRDLLDPEKVDSAYDRLSEAKYGMKPSDLVNRLNQAEENVEALRARAEAELFVKTTPEYYICDDNFYAIANWIVKNELAPVCENFKLAFNTLNAAGLLTSAPTMREEIQPAVETRVETPVVAAPVIPAKTQSEAEPVSRITEEEPSQPRRVVGVASGLTRHSVSPQTAASTQSNTLTIEAIERMSADEYKRRLRTERDFAKRVDEAYAERDRQRAARLQQ